MTNAGSNNKSITINRIHDVTTVTTLDRITGKATVETSSAIPRMGSSVWGVTMVMRLDGFIALHY